MGGISPRVVAAGWAGRDCGNGAGVCARSGRVRRDVDAGGQHTGPHANHADRDLLRGGERQHARGPRVGEPDCDPLAGDYPAAESGEEDPYHCACGARYAGNGAPRAVTHRGSQE